LSDETAQCESTATVLDTIAPFIVEKKLSLDETAATKLGTQLTFFIEKVVGVVNESVLSMTKEKTSWPVPMPWK